MFCNREEVLGAEAVTFSVDGHLVLSCPFRAGLVRPCHIVGGREVPGAVPHRAEGLHVEFFPVHPVKAFGHEVSALVVFQQTTFAHLDSGSLRHEVIRIFDATVGFPILLPFFAWMLFYSFEKIPEILSMVTGFRRSPVKPCSTKSFCASISAVTA